MKKNFLVYFVLLFATLAPFDENANRLQQQDVELVNPSVENQYPDGIRFYIEACSLPQDASIVLKTKTYRNWDEYTWEEYGEIADEGITPNGCQAKTYFLKKGDLASPPFSPVKYKWVVRGNSETILESDEYLHYYKNDDFDWVSQSSGLVTLWWHDRPDYFGAQLLSVAEQAVRDQASFFELELNQPITIVIFNTPDELGGWQKIDEGYGGFAFPAISFTAQVIGSFDTAWMNEVIPHEISHLYFYQIGKTQSYVSPWLNEGVAVYHEYSDHLSEWRIVKDAYERDLLTPFKQLDLTFNDIPDRRPLDYAQSYYAILFMEEKYGHEKVLLLLDSYREGYNLENAVKKAFGVTVSGLEIEYKEWLSERLKTPPPDTSNVVQPATGDPSSVQFAGLILFFTVLFCLSIFGSLVGLSLLGGLVVVLSKKQPV